MKMKINQPLKLLLLLLILNNWLPCFSQPDYFKTEYDSGKVIINTIVPNARYVLIYGGGGSWGLNNLSRDFTKSGDSSWQVTLDPASLSYLTPGFHYYYFEVNGISTSNPNERVYFGSSYWNSGIEIPDTSVNFYEIKDVPHGTIRMQLYYASTAKKIRRCFIYLPPGYDTKSDEKYPVLFLQHGSSESEFSWHMQGKMNFILDNLIAEGKAVPMIVVMENGETTGDYSGLVLKDLIPLLEKNYKIKTGKMNLATAGLSMGSNLATILGFSNLGKFGYIGAFSGGVLTAPSKHEQINDSLIVLYDGYGVNDELLIGQDFESSLVKYKVNHVNAQFSGGHEWQVWRKCLHQFAQLLFKPYTYDNPYTGNTIQFKNSFSVYPNPFNGQIHLQFDNDAWLMNAHYTLNDLSGNQILSFTGEKNDAEAEISDALRSSSCKLFILSVSDQTNVYRKKIVKCQ